MTLKSRIRKSPLRYLAGAMLLIYQLFHVPRTPAEAFAVTIRPGQIKWVGQPQTILCEQQPIGPLGREERVIYRVIDSKKGMANLYAGAGKVMFSASMTAGAGRTLIRCYQNDAMHGYSGMLWACVNFAFAHRPGSSGMSKEELTSKRAASLVEELDLRRLTGSDVLSMPRIPRGTMAVFVYCDDERANFLRFGTLDANELACIVRGTASLLDCIIYARENIGTGWIIMANA